MTVLISFTITSLWLTGCSAPAGRTFTDSKLVEQLETTIVDNGSKMFVYRLRMPMSEQTPIPVIGGSDMRDGREPVARRDERGRRAPERGGVALDRNSLEALRENVAHVVLQSGFCRDGYLEFDRQLTPAHLWLRGECKDGATDEDLHRFGSKKVLDASYWVSKP
jgi:hypothetical protein